MSTYANPEALVDTDWLADNLDAPDIRIVEVDEDLSAYDKAHIPGAIAWNWSKDLHHPVRRDYLDRQELQSLLRRSGVPANGTVVIYGGNNNWFAAYAYWILKLRGFDSVRLLDGGRTKWELEGRPLTQDVPQVPATGISITGPGRPELRALRDQVIGSVGQAEFVDVRSPEEFSGAKLAPDHLPQEQPYVGGHIPGATNIPWSKAANEDGTFRSREELESLYQQVNNGSEVIAYCRIGERAAHTWFVLHELLGQSKAKNYDGSWTEYGSLVGVPVERG